MKKALCLMLSILFLTLLISCSEDMASSNISSTDSLSPSQQQEPTYDTSKADDLIEQALKQYTPDGVPVTEEQLKIVQRGVDASLFVDLVDCEGFIIEFAVEDGEVYPDWETYNEGEGYVEIEPFEQKIGEDVYKITNFKSLENLLEDTISGDCKKEYMYFDDGSSILASYYKDIDGKLFARYIGKGSMYYYPNPIVEKTIVKKAEKDYYLFSVPIAGGYKLNSSENEYEVDRLDWYNYEMVKVGDVWKLNNSVDYDESVAITVKEDGTVEFEVYKE